MPPWLMAIYVYRVASGVVTDQVKAFEAQVQAATASQAKLAGTVEKLTEGQCTRQPLLLSFATAFEVLRLLCGRRTCGSVGGGHATYVACCRADASAGGLDIWSSLCQARCQAAGAPATAGDHVVQAAGCGGVNHVFPHARLHELCVWLVKVDVLHVAGRCSTHMHAGAFEAA